jgi:hypothetical protein
MNDSADFRPLFFLRVEEAGEVARRCERTLPLWPLVLILDADGALAADARYLVEMVRA